MNGWIEFVVGPVVVMIVGALVSRSTARANRKSQASAEAAKAAMDEAKLRLDEQRQEQRAAADNRRADGEAYERAVSINRQMVDDLMREVQRLHLEVQTLREQLDAKEIRESQLEKSMQALERTVGRLKQLLKDHDIPVPGDV